MTTYFYKDVNNLFHVGESILPSGNYLMRIYYSDTIISLESADTHRLTLDATEITQLLKENGTPYTDLTDLLNGVQDLFKIV